MSTANEIQNLLERSAADGMVLRTVSLPAAEVVYFKSVLEAYPGIGMLLAPARGLHTPRAHALGDGRTSVTVVASRGFEADIEALLADLGAEIDLRVEEASGLG